MRQGFTLIEVATVLVIIGLIVGGALVGQSMIHTSQLLTVSDEFKRYTTAIGVFRTKYSALPGDMYNATQYWGAADNNIANGPNSTCGSLTTPSTNKKTCNGDGNGYIISGYGYGPQTSEWWRAWQHLANAGLVAGSYSGVAGSAVNSELAVIGTNVPASHFPNGGWTLAAMDPPVSTCPQDAYGNCTGPYRYYKYEEEHGTLPLLPRYGNVLTFGTDAAHYGAQSSNQWTIEPVLTPLDAHDIDTKLDDGQPNSGKVVTFYGGNNNGCAGPHPLWVYPAQPIAPGSYSLTGNDRVCTLVFLTGF